MLNIVLKFGGSQNGRLYKGDEELGVLQLF